MKETSLALSKNNTKANKMFGSADDLTPTKGFQKHCHPNSYFRKLWNSMILLGLIFYIFSIPLSFFYLIENTPFTETPLLLIMGYAVDVFFVVDAVFEFHYFMHFEAGLIVFDKNHIHQQFYKSHNCFREVVGILPFDLLSCLFGGKFVHLFRLSKIARIPNIAMFIESADILLAELKIDIDLSLYRVIKLNILMITVCHWVCASSLFIFYI